MELTGGPGPQVVFECAAAPSTLEHGPGPFSLSVGRWWSEAICLATHPGDAPQLDRPGKYECSPPSALLPEDWRIALELISVGASLHGPHAEGYQLHPPGRNPERLRVAAPPHQRTANGGGAVTVKELGLGVSAKMVEVVEVDTDWFKGI